MNAVNIVTGKDSKGIVAKVSAKCVELGANIADISQTVMSGYFAMILLVETDGISVPFPDFVDSMEHLGGENGLVIKVMHEDIFNSMHRI